MEYKIAVVGAGGVGKSAVVVRFIQGNFVEKYDPTIEDTYRKTVEVDNSARLLDIMDTAGQEEYAALRGQYIKGGDGFLLIYSVEERASFDALHKIRTQILRIKESAQDIPMLLLGNKCDLPSRDVTEEDGNELAAKWRCKFLEASAKTNHNIDKAFCDLVRNIDDWRKKHAPASKDRKSRAGCVVL
mmetsp:Transcript_32901/g.51433  ORF Transcript_32901/g.51433 Transcript_32901/m.51433 type:complete len:187 (-) Transcript_32901:124-684(-)